MNRTSPVLRVIIAAASCIWMACAQPAHAQPQSGACCLPTGVCTQASKCECDTQGGGFAGPGVTCAAANCSVFTFGACCAPTGCIQTTAQNCQAFGGGFQANNVCGLSGCAAKQPVACCCGSVCTLTDNFFCSHQGGVPNINVVTCSPSPCVPGVCCDPATGACQFIAPCPAGWNPVAGAGCNPASNPCFQQSAGVCCDALGNCTLFIPGTVCNGVILPTIFSCNPNPCPPVPCCDAQGNCTLVPPGGCSGTVPSTSSCQPNPCPTSVCCDPASGNCSMLVPCPAGWTVVAAGACSPVNPCPPASGQGACCDYRGGCYLTPAASTCTGVFFPNQTCAGVTCPQFGSCCQPCTGACQSIASGTCPPAWVFTPNSTCTPNTCSLSPVFGSCCFVPASGGQGFCGMSTSCDCVFKGGAWLGSTPCTPAFCTTQALGACCNAATQVCTTNVTTLTCQDAGGQFFPGQTCTTVASCNQPTSACCCCGLCHNLDPAVCALSGGVLVLGAVCSPTSCSGNNGGACCDSSTGTCTPVPAASSCTGVGQTFYPGQSCAQITAACTPTPGACCDLLNGNCLQVLQSNCPAPFYQWIGGACTPAVVCPRTAGACCDPGNNICFMVPVAGQCIAPNVFLGVGQSCTPGVVCRPPIVACCNPSTGLCQIITGNGCPVGLFPSPTGTCNNSSTGQAPCPQPGACCNPATGQCTYIIAGQCPFPVWLPNTACNPNPCGPVACCDPTTGNCQQIFTASCPTGTNPLPGQTCQPTNPCPRVGACCPFGSAFCTQTTQANCNGPWSQGTPCTTVSCVRACCRNDGSCFLVVSSYRCPAGTNPIAGFCQPNQCPKLGPCCNFFTGSCSITQQSRCRGLGSSWGPAGATCAPNPCLGSCCNPTTLSCVYTVAWACLSSNIYTPGGVCNPNPCQPVGPCCFQTGACSILTQSQCTAQGGFIWFGPGNTCQPNTCHLSPCCLANGQCATIYPLQCTQQGGVLSTAASCGPTVCRGACCTPPNIISNIGPLGTHCIFTFQAACQGQWRGYGTTCASPQGGTNYTSCCPQNFNGTNGVTVQDIFDYLAAYFGNNPAADFNGVGGLSVQDIFDFLSAYFTPCS